MKPTFVDRYYFISLEQLREAFGVQGERIVTVSITGGAVQLQTLSGDACCCWHPGSRMHRTVKADRPTPNERQSMSGRTQGPE